MTLQPGETILNGKYHVLKLIGEGGMARVWLAEEPRFGSRKVAIKEPRADLLPDLVQEVRLRYQREVQVCAALAQVRVPNIVRAITAELYDGSLLLVMEYMPGGDLVALLKANPNGLPVERAVAVAQDLLRALAGVHGHELEIVHRDVKPSNVLFDGQGTAHLADFGLAQLAGMSGRSQLVAAQHPGTLMYMAPEQARSPDMLLPAADLYALGCVLFEILTGKRYKRLKPGTTPSMVRVEVPGWLDGVLARALEEDPWDRYQEAAKMAAVLGAGERAAQVLLKSRLQEIAERERAAEDARRQAEEKAHRQALDVASQAPLWQQIGIEMVTIPAGTFLYGDKKKEAHLPEYCLARTPVTNLQYKAFVDATGHRAPHHWKKGHIPPGKDDHPVVYVSWEDAIAFCRWAGCRLSTEQEWEKGARGTDGREYPWGDSWQGGRCNTFEAGIGDTTPVGRYPNGASPYGLLDMAGNVWEWCDDRYDAEHEYKVLRGGSWYFHSDGARSAGRYWYYPDYRYINIGFRCGMSPTSSP
jgi:formylglycine-generating enzyme required for sulfatase activity/tRNA A-37 threonylcarbamoyl transferase component Bud32